MHACRSTLEDPTREGKASKPEPRKSRPGLGIQVASDELARKVGVESGVVVARVLPGTPAEKAGLIGSRVDDDKRVVLGDVIVAIDGKDVEKVDDLFGALKGYEVGKEVAVTIVRNGKRIDRKVTLGAVD